jgi:hypothetical protein
VASSDATSVQLRMQAADDSYVLNGRKWFTSNAMHPLCELLAPSPQLHPASRRQSRARLYAAAEHRLARAASVSAPDAITDPLPIIGCKGDGGGCGSGCGVRGRLATRHVAGRRGGGIARGDR